MSDSSVQGYNRLGFDWFGRIRYVDQGQTRFTERNAHYAFIAEVDVHELGITVAIIDIIAVGVTDKR